MRNIKVVFYPRRIFIFFCFSFHKPMEHKTGRPLGSKGFKNKVLVESVVNGKIVKVWVDKE